MLSLDNNNVLFSRNVKFYETVMPFKSKRKFSETSSDSYSDHLKFFDFPNDLPNVSQSPNDEGRLSDFSDGTSVDCDINTQSIDTMDDTSATLDESEFPEGNNSENISDHNDPGSTEDDVVRRSSRIRVFPDKFKEFQVDSKVKYPISNFVNYCSLSEFNIAYVSALDKSKEPKNYLEASTDLNWVNAMNNEMDALNRNNTWELTELPVGRKAIGCKWIYKIKYRSNGEIERYKARLVAKGYS